MSLHFKTEDEDSYTSFNLKEKLVTMLNKVKRMIFRIKDCYSLQIEKIKYYKCSIRGVKSRSVKIKNGTCGKCELNGI